MKFFSFPTAVKTLTLCATLCILGQAAHATEYVWSGNTNGQPADWFAAKNWEAEVPSTPVTFLKKAVGSLVRSANSEPSGVPGPGDCAIIGAGANVAINQPAVIGNLTVEDGGTLQGSGAVSVTESLVLDGSKLLGTGKVTLATSATIKVTDGGEGVDNLIAKTIDNKGNMIWESGHVTLQKDFLNHGTVYLGCDGALNAVVPNSGNAPKFYNDGTVIKAISIGQSLFDAEFVNTGDIYVRSGQLNVGPSFTQTSGSLNLDGGDVATSGTFEINGGIVKGIGTLDGSVVNDGGTFKPGHSPGYITIMGNYTQTSNGTLEMEIGGTDAGTQYDQMNVYGSANLNGELEISKWNNYTPAAGTNFYLITSYNMSNDFATFTGIYLGNQLYYQLTKSPSDYIAAVWADTAAPTLNVTQPAANTSYNSIGSAKGTATDYYSGVNKVTCRLYRFAVGSTPAGYWAGGTSWTTGYTAANNEKLATGTTNWTWVLPSLATGQYYVKVTARDNVGNSVQSANIVFNKVASGGNTAAATAPSSNSASSSTVARLFPEDWPQLRAF